MKNGLKVPLKFLKFVFFGPPGAGKTTFVRRLIGEIEKVEPNEKQPSTLTAVQKELMIKGNKTVVINPSSNELKKVESKWYSVTREKGECTLDDEALMIYHFISDQKFQSNKGTLDHLPQTNKTSHLQPRTSTSTEASNHITASDQPQITNQITSHPNETVESSAKADSSSSDEAESSPSDEAETSPSDEADGQTEVEKDYNHDLTSTIVTKFKEIVNRWQTLYAKKDSQIVEVLSKSIMVNVMDVGGQPPFLEMVPALAHGPGLYLICFNLQNEVDKRYDVFYVTDEKKEHKLPYTYSVLEVLFHCLSSMACFSPRRSNELEHLLLPPHSKAAMIIGTHKDKLGDDADSIVEAIDKKIRDELDELEKYDCMGTKYYHNYLSLSQYSDTGKILTAVNNTLGNDEIQDHRRRIEQIVDKLYRSESKSELFQIPASWLMFSIFLRKIERNVLSIEECKDIAKELGILEDDVKHVLSFLHHDVGIIMYYAKDEVKGLDEDVILCQPQVMFKSIGELILNVFLPGKNDQKSKQIRDSFWLKGQFRLKDIESSNATDGDQLSSKQLICILQHLNVLCQLRSGVFFMPAVMKAASRTVLDRYKHRSAISPLLIRFECVFVPIGCFTAMIAQLVRDEEKNEWALVSEKDDLYKDVVTFVLPGSFKLILICHPKRYEIHLCPIPNRDTNDIEKIASGALRTVCGALDTVLIRLRGQYTSQSDLTVYSLGFFCCGEHTDKKKHLMLINKKLVDHKTHWQSAKCIKDKSDITLQSAHLVWNGSHKFGSKCYNIIISGYYVCYSNLARRVIAAYVIS